MILAVEYSKSFEDRDSMMIRELEEKANKIEKDLIREVAGFDEALRQVTWKEVQSVLKPHEVAIEFMHYKFNNPEPTDSIMYVALILKKGDELPQIIPLFEENALNASLSFRKEDKVERMNDLYTYKSRGAVPVKKKNKSLYD